MTDEKWDEAEEEALKALIRDTINAAGPIDPAALPHRIKERLKGQATGEVDLDALIKEALSPAPATLSARSGAATRCHLVSCKTFYHRRDECFVVSPGV